MKKNRGKILVGKRKSGKNLVTCKKFSHFSPTFFLPDKVVEQKNILGLLAAKSGQSKSAVDIKYALSFPLSSVSLFLASANGAMRKKKKSNLYGASDSLSNRNTSLENYTGVNNLFVHVPAALRAVKMYQRRSKI